VLRWWRGTTRRLIDGAAVMPHRIPRPVDSNQSGTMELDNAGSRTWCPHPHRLVFGNWSVSGSLSGNHSYNSAQCRIYIRQKCGALALIFLFSVTHSDALLRESLPAKHCSMNFNAFCGILNVIRSVHNQNVGPLHLWSLVRRNSVNTPKPGPASAKQAMRSSRFRCLSVVCVVKREN